MSVIIPVFNEINTLQEIIKRVHAVSLEKEIIIVDDFSTDGTRELLPNIKDVKVILQKSNQGKGAAIREGIRQANGDYLIIQDADLEYDPNDYIKLLQYAKNNQVVYGSRFLENNYFPSITHYFGNKFLTWLCVILYRAPLTDMETCYKLIPTNIIKQIPLRANRFDFEPEITAKILKRGHKIIEVPIFYKGRQAGEGKKISWKDGFSAVWALVKYRFYE